MNFNFDDINNVLVNTVNTIEKQSREKSNTANEELLLNLKRAIENDNTKLR